MDFIHFFQSVEQIKKYLTFISFKGSSWEISDSFAEFPGNKGQIMKTEGFQVSDRDILVHGGGLLGTTN